MGTKNWRKDFEVIYREEYEIQAGIIGMFGALVSHLPDKTAKEFMDKLHWFLDRLNKIHNKNGNKKRKN